MISDMLKVRDERIHRILARSSILVRNGCAATAGLSKVAYASKVGGPGSRYTRLGELKWNAPKTRMSYAKREVGAACALLLIQRRSRDNRLGRPHHARDAAVGSG